MFEGLDRTGAICWGAEDIVSLAKEVTRLAEDKDLAPFSARGGVMDGEPLSADQVRADQQVAQPRGAVDAAGGADPRPGRRLAAQLNGPGGALASQIAQKGEEEERRSGSSPGTDQPNGSELARVQRHRALRQQG